MTRAMAGDVALMRYHEIVLKGRNRPYFVRRLAEHVARLVVDLPVGPVKAYSDVGFRLAFDSPAATLAEARYVFAKAP